LAATLAELATRRVDLQTHHHHELAGENAAGVQIRNRLPQFAWERHGVGRTRRRAGTFFRVSSVLKSRV
jgi:hypothetical protein